MFHVFSSCQQFRWILDWEWELLITYQTVPPVKGMQKCKKSVESEGIADNILLLTRVGDVIPLALYIHIVFCVSWGAMVFKIILLFSLSLSQAVSVKGEKCASNLPPLLKR